MAYSSEIAAILKTCKLGTADQLAKVADCTEEHAKKILMGHRQISKKIALRLKKHTNGRLTTDYLFSLTEDNRRGQ